jgi:hypothetical protein
MMKSRPLQLFGRCGELDFDPRYIDKNGKKMLRSGERMLRLFTHFQAFRRPLSIQIGSLSVVVLITFGVDGPGPAFGQNSRLSDA